MLGRTKFKSHIKVVMLNMLNVLIPRNENKYTAIPPFITTSKTNIDGIVEAIKYMELITVIASM